MRTQRTHQIQKDGRELSQVNGLKCTFNNKKIFMIGTSHDIGQKGNANMTDLKSI